MSSPLESPGAWWNRKLIAALQWGWGWWLLGHELEQLPGDEIRRGFAVE